MASALGEPGEFGRRIGDSQQRASLLTEVTEAVSKQLDSHVMVVAAGQSALTEIQLLTYLLDRFTIRVPLSDAEVETVTRKVLLQKKPTAVADVRALLDKHAGEVSRQLQGTRIGETIEDRAIIVDDYPLLPVRRRFWENCFRQIDAAGTSSQLRSQLRIIHDAVAKVSERHLGSVVPADELFEALAPEMVNTGVLLREINERIILVGRTEGPIAQRICGLVFLIGKLKREAGADTGVRATKDHLADLLIDDLAADNGKLRSEVEDKLKTLSDQGMLMLVGDEYRLQTREGSDWDREFRNRQTKLNNDDAGIQFKRDQLLYGDIDKSVRAIRVMQGAAKEPRQFLIHREQTAPVVDGSKAADELGINLQCCQKADEVEDPQHRLSFAKRNEDLFAALSGGAASVGGGTAWLWSRPDAFETVDVLFVDEAAQMSLANVLAVSQAAKTVVLIGDPQQLDQPMQGSHPEGTDVSALDHILGGDRTIPTDKGLFLEETWRLHPAICAYTSELFYDGKLSSKTGLEKQVIKGSRPISGSGLYFLPVAHSGNQNCSPEEAKAIDSLVRAVLASSATWVDREGKEKPITLDDIVIITPYNAQVFEIQQGLPGARVGTVDKFQGQEAPIAIYSTATSSHADAPRGMEFLYSLNRLNVATSRAKCASIVVGSADRRATCSRGSRLHPEFRRLGALHPSRTVDGPRATDSSRRRSICRHRLITGSLILLSNSPPAARKKARRSSNSRRRSRSGWRR
jgi:hypothetical protein